MAINHFWLNLSVQPLRLLRYILKLLRERSRRDVYSDGNRRVYPRQQNILLFGDLFYSFLKLYSSRLITMLTSNANFLSGAFGADEVEDVGDLEGWCTIDLNIARAVFPIQF